MIPNFSAKLKAKMIERNISQTSLAKAIGVSQQAISEWIKGKSLPSLETYRLLCEVLEVDANYMLNLSLHPFLR